MGAERGARQRRAQNIIWTAAGDYGFRPEFMAFHRDGSPDLYLNSIVGFVHRHYDMGRLSEYMHEFDGSLLRDMFSDLLWIGLEQAAFEREAPYRPALPELRRAHARRWLEEDVDLSMQQLMMRSEIVHTMKRARCHESLGEAVELRNPWDRRLYVSLRFSGEMGTEEIVGEMQRIWRTFFLFRLTGLGRKRIHLLLGQRWTAFLRRWLPMKREYGWDIVSSEPQMLATGEGIAPDGGEGSLRRAGGHSRAKELQELFGPQIFGRDRIRQVEEKLCRGSHEGTHLWFSSGKRELQSGNLARYRDHLAQYRNGIRRLRDHLRNCLAVFRQPMEISSRCGMLRSGDVWRAEYLKDTKVFSAWEEVSHEDLSLLLLLDASASREGQQEILACEAYVMAEGIRRAGIPVSVVSFCSLSGYTILQRMKAFDDDDAKGVFCYASRGWNRDGLALRAVPELLQGIGGRILVMVLTDAYPSDEVDIPARGIRFARRYLQEPAVEDTAEAVQELRRQGIRVTGIVNSVFSEGIIEGYADRIYGNRWARIPKISRLADVVGSLLEREIREED